VARLVVDTSVAVKWFVPETGAAEAVALLEGGDELCCPDLLFAEAANVLWKKTQRQELTKQEAADVLDALGGVGLAAYPLRPLAATALELATETGSTVYDCLYLVLAASLRAPLITADRRFATRQKSGPLGRYVRILGESLT
jgi:predicted nucleic acid-binding protein